jgi:CRP-like cAMP-binding protein
VLLRFFRERLLDRLIATSPLFAPFSGEESRLLTERFHFLEFEPGAVLIREGEKSEGLFVILCGEAAVTQVENGQIATIGPGGVCGEMSLLTRQPAMATVHARTRLWALAMPKGTFQELILTHPQVLIFINELAESRQKQVSERLSMF